MAVILKRNWTESTRSILNSNNNLRKGGKANGKKKQ